MFAWTWIIHVQRRKTIAAFEQLAQRLEAMAAERTITPWWRWLLRRAG
jgi:hypothetical protein